MEQQIYNVDEQHVQNPDQGVLLNVQRKRQTKLFELFWRIPLDGNYLNGNSLLGRGLTTERIVRFDHFTADESPVGKHRLS